MEQPVIIPVAALPPRTPTLPVGFVPTPSAAYRLHRTTVAQAGQPGVPHPKAAPPPGARVLMWKQDPSVLDMGTRKAFLPGVLLEGPSDARIASGQPGIAPVAPNAFGDFVVLPDTDQFDAVHTFAVVRQTLTMFQRVLAAHDGGPAPWAWNSASDTAPLQVFPHGLPNVMNAYYSRTERALKFGDFVPAGATADAAARVYACRSFDIVAHETAHAVLDGLKPRWILASAPPQTGGLHESFGDLAAIFLALAQMDQVEAIVAQTRADLHDKTFLADMAEQFGLALGRPNGLRNADNDLTLSQTGTEVHAISQVFTGAVYDILADIFAFERRPGLEDDAAVLHRVGGYLCGLTLRALVAAPERNATYADVANAMLRLARADGRPDEYLGFIRHRFTLREVVVGQGADGLAAELVPAIVDAPDAVQDRRACCGTMNHPEYRDDADALEQERQALARWCHGYAARGGREPASSEELAAADYGVGQDAS